MAWRTIAVAFVLAAPAFASGPTPPEKGLAAEHAQVRAAATQARNAGEPGRHADRFAELYRRRLTAMLGQLPAQPESDLHELFAVLEEASFYAVFRASIAYDNAAWSGVVFGSTPSFHYFRGGTLVHSHEGWDDETGVTEFVEQLESTGLIASDAGTNHAADSANAPP